MRNEPTPEFSNWPAFSPKLLWNPHTGHPNLEVFLSQIENERFQIPGKCLAYSNLSKDEWQAIRSLAEDRSIVIKKEDKGLRVVISNSLDYLSEAEKQLGDKSIYKNVSFNDKILRDLVETSNKMFLNLKRKGSISEKEMKYFVYDYKNASNLGKLYFLPKIHKRFSNVPGRPVISNCGTPTEKASKFLYYHLKPVMQRSSSYIKDTGDFIEKIKRINNIPDDSILVMADVVGLYISHELGLKASEEALEKRDYTDFNIRSCQNG